MKFFKELLIIVIITLITTAGTTILLYNQVNIYGELISFKPALNFGIIISILMNTSYFLIKA